MLSMTSDTFFLCRLVSNFSSPECLGHEYSNLQHIFMRPAAMLFRSVYYFVGISNK